MVATVRCAPPQNKPTVTERDTCAPWIEAELGAARRPRPGRGRARLATAGTPRCARSPASAGTSPGRSRGSATAPRPRLVGDDREVLLLGCYHPSQQNTFTGRLTEPMLDDVLGRAAAAARLPDVARPCIPTGRGSRLKSDSVWVRIPAGAPFSGL